MDAQPISVGLIGAGYFAQAVHIPSLALLPELRWTALATSREETARPAGERWRVRAFADYRELLRKAEVEAVIVATPARHFEAIAGEAIERGKHVFLESPGVGGVEESRALREKAAAAGRVVQVGFCLRYAHAFTLLKEHSDGQASPRLWSFEYFPYLHHIYNLALYLAGPVARVLCATNDSAGRAAALRFRNGDTALILGRTLANCGLDLETARVSTPRFFASVEGRRRVRIVSGMEETPVASWSLERSPGTTYEAQPFAARFLEASGQLPQLRAFARAIRTGEPPHSGLADAQETCELAALIERALS